MSGSNGLSTRGRCSGMRREDDGASLGGEWHPPKKAVNERLKRT